MPKAWHANVCFGSKADIAARLDDVRFTPKSGHWNSVAKCPLCAKSGPSAMQRKRVLFDRRLGEPEATETTSPTPVKSHADFDTNRE